MSLLLVVGYFSFVFIDLSKLLYELQLFDYMGEYVPVDRKRLFKFFSLVAEVVGKLTGALVSSFYVILKTTNKSRFSYGFGNNIQFAFYLAVCINVFAIFMIFLFWPKMFNHKAQVEISPPKSLTELFFPGLTAIKHLEMRNQFLLQRLFLLVGIYWQVATSITVWIETRFTMDVPRMISNAAYSRLTWALLGEVYV